MQSIINLKNLIANIRSAIQNDKVSTEFIDHCIEALSKLGFKTYDSQKFPQLKGTENFKGNVNDSPSNLAEALLWKMGKWQTYITFVENYNDKDLVVSKKGGVVFSAFAKHLQDPDYPIYDQHAIRALWATGVFNNTETAKCKALLLDRNDYWKATGTGDDGECYEIFLKHIGMLCKKNEITNDKLDKLLMPLGQALKKETHRKKQPKSTQTDLDRFQLLCADTQNAAWKNSASRIDGNALPN